MDLEYPDELLDPDCCLICHMNDGPLFSKRCWYCWQLQNLQKQEPAPEYWPPTMERTWPCLRLASRIASAGFAIFALLYLAYFLLILLNS